MSFEDRISLPLVLLRLSVFLVFFMWTIDKFLRPGHASGVFEKFYKIGGLGRVTFYIIGVLEGLIILAFLLGLAKRYSYGAVLVLHGISTLSSYSQYLHPFQNVNLLFFAAWPMLAACFTLFYLRRWDTRWTL